MQKKTLYLNVTVRYSTVSRAVRHTAASNIHNKSRIIDPCNITYSTYPGITKKAVTGHKRRMWLKCKDCKHKTGRMDVYEEKLRPLEQHYS